MPDERSWWKRHWLILLYLVSTAIVILQRLEPSRHGVFLIFRTAFFELTARRNLYAMQPHIDYFRYSPTFALLFAPMALVPWQLGVALWTLLNALTLYYVIGRLLPPRQALWVRFIVLGDLIRSLQSSQSNAIVATLMIAAFLAYEREQTWRGAWAVMGGAAIKLFPVGAALFALLKPSRWRAMAQLVVVGVVMFLLPAVILGLPLLIHEYHWWFANEAAEVFKPMYSVMDLIDAWTNTYWTRWPIQLTGLVLLLIPVIARRDAWTEAGWRLRLLCSVLVFCVLFNHGAESPSYVIAMSGIATWWAMTPHSRTRNVLLILTLLFSTVGRSSLVPVSFRMAVLDPARVMVMPLLASWLLMQFELLRGECLLTAEVDEPDTQRLEPGTQLAG